MKVGISVEHRTEARSKMRAKKILPSPVIVYRNAAAFYGVNRTGLDRYVLILPSVPDAMQRGSREMSQGPRCVVENRCGRYRVPSVSSSFDEVAQDTLGVMARMYAQKSCSN